MIATLRHRIAVCALGVLLAAVLCPSPVAAVYTGHVDGVPSSTIKLRVANDKEGRRDSVAFRARDFPLDCDDGTESIWTEFPMRLRFSSSHRFSGDRSYVEPDPLYQTYYYVSGRVDRREARGRLVLISDLTFPSVGGSQQAPDCSTGGPIRWKAERVKQP